MAALETLQKAVDDLYNFRDKFFEHHALEEASRKDTLVEKKMKETLQLIESNDEDPSKGQTYYLEGKTLNVLPVANQKAEKLLEKAIKLDPKLTDAWNQLGECYWKSGKPSEARDCFLGALQCQKNKVSLRNLSIVSRHFDQGTQKYLENVKKSLEYAKEAVAVDVSDGQSWAILGNAYMSLFFTGGQEWDMVDKALAAFSNAEKDKISFYSPDLHYNKASLCRYLEDYQTALEGFHMAACLDPGWPSPQKEADSLVHHLKQFNSLIQTKGKLRAKQLEKHIERLKLTPDGGVLSKMLEGGSAELNVVIVGHSSTCTVPMCLVCVDGEGVAMGVTLYNIAEGKGPLVGDILRIPSPKFIKVSLDQYGVNFTSITARDPTILTVNSKPFPKAHLSPTAFTVSAPQK